MDFPAMTGFGHIDFTVTDGERSEQWWEQVMGFQLVSISERPGFTIRGMNLPGTRFTVQLVTHEHRVTDTFNEHAVGLDHFAMRVPDRTALEAWARHFDLLGVEHSGVQEEQGGPLIVFRDPDNIQLELWAVDPSLGARRSEKPSA
jgi:catechol 2,3-dioxygenase-like lactoylglutathione lyase family enzyme